MALSAENENARRKRKSQVMRVMQRGVEGAEVADVAASQPCHMLSLRFTQDASCAAWNFESTTTTAWVSSMSACSIKPAEIAAVRWHFFTHDHSTLHVLIYLRRSTFLDHMLELQT